MGIAMNALVSFGSRPCENAFHPEKLQEMGVAATV
jgi:hypothetical protein